MSWKNKTVLITGGCGFIGSHLVEHLQANGARIRVFARYTSSGSVGNLSFLKKKNFNIIYGDLRNPSIVKQSMKNIDIVFHLASLISIPYSYRNPREYFDVNVNAILNILEAARELSTELIIHTSTSEVYGSAKYVPIDEKHTLHAQSPYSASKIAADKLVESFYRSFDLPVITIRPFNTFGPRQTTRAVIPTIIQQLLKGPNIYLGDVTPTRDFLYVKDTVRGFITAAENSKILLGDTFNIGTGKEITIRELITLIGGILGVDPKIDVDKRKLRPKKSEVNRLCCDASKFTTRTDWKPQYSLKEGLTESIDFYRDSNIETYTSPDYE